MAAVIRILEFWYLSKLKNVASFLTPSSKPQWLTRWLQDNSEGLKKDSLAYRMVSAGIKPDIQTISHAVPSNRPRAGL